MYSMRSDILAMGMLFLVVFFTPDINQTTKTEIIQLSSCQSDADCILREFSYCCTQETRTANACFLKGEIQEIKDCTYNDTCMKMREPDGCMCRNGQCAGTYEKPKNTSISISVLI